MRKNRFIGQDRCYHLISRLAHRAFFLDDEENDRAVAFMRRKGVAAATRRRAMSDVARTCHNNPMSLMQEYRLA